MLPHQFEGSQILGSHLSTGIKCNHPNETDDLPGPAGIVENRNDHIRETLCVFIDALLHVLLSVSFADPGSLSLLHLLCQKTVCQRERLLMLVLQRIDKLACYFVLIIKAKRCDIGYFMTACRIDKAIVEAENLTDVAPYRI